jgi:branched-subunit amino acid ABC-type transport system permease component
LSGLETIVALFSDQVIAQVAVFLVAIIILRLRPQGIYSGK